MNLELSWGNFTLRISGQWKLKRYASLAVYKGTIWLGFTVTFFLWRLILSKQKVQTLMKCHIMQYFIWVFTACAKYLFWVSGLQRVNKDTCTRPFCYQKLQYMHKVVPISLKLEPDACWIWDNSIWIVKIEKTWFSLKEHDLYFRLI